MSPRFKLSFCPAWIGICLLTAGCGPGYKLVPVSGRVTLDGKPVADAHVNFEPRARGPGSYGKADQEGRFTLVSVFDDRRGAVPGAQVVLITTAKEEPGSDASQLVGELAPPRFLDGSVTFNVPAEGTDAANFDLGGSDEP